MAPAGPAGPAQGAPGARRAFRRRPRPASLAALGLGLAAAAAAAVAFTAGPRGLRERPAGCGRGLRAGRPPRSAGATACRAEAFDPFGWKGKFKDTVQGLMDGMGEEEPSKLEKAMMFEIFSTFDVDEDGILNLDEFNALQRKTEGDDAEYKQDQLEQLLLTVDPDLEHPEKGMPFATFRRLYVERRLRNAYNTDVSRDHVKIFGPDGGKAAEFVAIAEEAAARAKAEQPEGLAEGTAVTVEGLQSAVDLNGKPGHIVAPLDSEADMVAEGRLIVQIEEGDRVALKPDNIKAKS